jgi:predicted transcriptional regulator
MDFYTLCKFYVQNYTKVKNNQKLTQYLIYSCKLLEIKRNKLKLGAIVFEIQPTVINNVLVNYSFEMVFARQPSANKSKKTMNEILTFFQ